MQLHRRLRFAQRRASARLLWLAAGLLAAYAGPVAAEGGPLSWSASRSGEALVLRPGVSLASSGNLRVGLESTLVAATATRAGTTSAPMVLWSQIDLPGASLIPATLGMRLDARSGAGRAVLRQSRIVSAGSVADLSLANSIEAGHRANGRSAFVGRQELRLEFPDIGVAVAGDAVLDNAAPLSASLRIEQTWPVGIRLSATLSDLHTAPNAVIRAGLNRHW